jgi:hypothetical protein
MDENIREIFLAAKRDYEEDRKSPLNMALREIMTIERENYYNKSNAHNKMRDIRAKISEFASKE